jgi:hypothetical protein
LTTTDRPIAQPLPPLLIAALESSPELAAWTEAAERADAEAAAVTAATRKLAAAREADARAEREAVRRSRPFPASKAEKVQRELEALQRRRDLARGLVDEARLELFEAGRGHAEEALGQADERIEAELDAVEVALHDAADAFERATASAGEHEWLRGYVRGSTTPWNGRPANVCRQTYGDVATALARLPEERQARKAPYEEFDRDEATYQEEVRRGEAEERRAQEARR